LDLLLQDQAAHVPDLVEVLLGSLEDFPVRSWFVLGVQKLHLVGFLLELLATFIDEKIAKSIHAQAVARLVTIEHVSKVRMRQALIPIRRREVRMVGSDEGELF